MKYSKFKELKIKNFLSVGDEMITIKFQDAGNGRINVITGENLDKKNSSNGIGKSTIIEAFYYALFGKTIRDIKQAFIINNITKKTGEVSISLESGGKEYRIERQIKPNKVFVYVDGKDETSSTISTNGEFITELLGYPPEVFEYCVIMSMQNSAVFMKAKAGDKRKIIEQNLNLNKFAEMLKKINLELTEFKKQQLQLLSSINTSEKFIEESKKNITQLEISIEKQEEELTARKEKILSNIDNISKEKKKLEEQIFKGETAISISKDENAFYISEVEKLNVLNKNMDMYTNDFKIHAAKVMDMKNRKGSCEHCKRPFTEHDNELIQKEIADGLDKCKKLKEQIVYSKALIELQIESNKNTLKRKDMYNEYKDIIEKKKYDLKNVEMSLKLYNEQLNDIKPNILFEQNLKDLSLELKTNILQLEKSKKNLEKINIEINVIEKAKFILGDDGIKTVLIERVIDIFNSLINKYLNEFESHYYIVFDKYFESTITSLSNIEVSYDNLSGAERKYIDIAIMLAFADLKKVQSNVETNILIFDELLDSAVDSNGINNIVDSLKKRHENVFIISHRKECKSIADDTGGECIFLVKENGITRKMG